MYVLLGLLTFGTVLVFEIPDTPDDALQASRPCSGPQSCGWVSGGVYHSVQLEIPEEEFASSMGYMTMRSGTVFVRSPAGLVDPGDEYVKLLAGEILRTSGDSDYDRACAALSLVQNSISYAEDTALYGCTEFCDHKLKVWSAPLTDLNHAWTIQVAIGVWKSLGYNAIIYLSAITSIDQELYEAADVDGANAWQKVLHVTVPGLLPTFFVLLLLAISNMLSNGFEQFWLLATGMTWDKLEVFDTYVYRMGIKNMEYSLATAMGIFKSIVSILLLTFANVASKKLRGVSIF